MYTAFKRKKNKQQTKFRKIIFTVCISTDYYVLRSFQYTLLKRFLGCSVQRVDIFKLVSAVKEETSELVMQF